MILDSDVENLKPKGYCMMNCQYDGVKVQFKLLSSQIQFVTVFDSDSLYMKKSMKIWNFTEHEKQSIVSAGLFQQVNCEHN